MFKISSQFEISNVRLGISSQSQRMDEDELVWVEEQGTSDLCQLTSHSSPLSIDNNDMIHIHYAIEAINTENEAIGDPHQSMLVIQLVDLM